MAAKTGAGDLRERVGFGAPQSSDDGAGGVQSDFAERFVCRAQYINLRGGETILAARLQGTHVQVIRVRSSIATRAVSRDWRIVDKRSADVFNIRDITQDPGRAFIDFLCETGVAI